MLAFAAKRSTESFLETYRVRKWSSCMGEVEAPNPNAFIINGPVQRNKPGEQYNESEEEEAHDREEDDKVHAEHPVQVHCQLSIGVVIHPLPALFSSEPERSEAPEPADDPVALRDAARCFQPVLDRRLLPPVLAALTARGLALQVVLAAAAADDAGKARALPIRFGFSCGGGVAAGTEP